MLLRDQVAIGRAHAHVIHFAPKGWRKDPRTGLLEPDYGWRDDPILGRVVDPDTAILLLEDETHNVITNAGRDFAHAQVYGTGPGANGLNYVALSNDTLTETSASTTLSNEIAANGLARAQGTVGHTAGTNTTTVQKTFTASGAQAAQKAALFTAGAGGTMNHALAFTQRSLQIGDLLAITFTITLG